MRLYYRVYVDVIMLMRLYYRVYVDASIVDAFVLPGLCRCEYS